MRGRVLLVVALGFVLGCNTSRYGLTYEERLPDLRTVAVSPVCVEVHSLHTGGVLEPRPDITSDVRPRLVGELKQMIQDRGCVGIAEDFSSSDPDVSAHVAQSTALLQAVEESIITHHYTYGRSTVFDYEIGKALADLAPAEADAVLCVSLFGVVPTKGREGLMVTAVVLGVLTGIHIHVKTNEAVLSLMLVDARNGEVLWYNRAILAADVRKERPLEKLVERTGKFLLKPKRGGG